MHLEQSTTPGLEEVVARAPNTISATVTAQLNPVIMLQIYRSFQALQEEFKYFKQKANSRRSGQNGVTSTSGLKLRGRNWSADIVLLPRKITMIFSLLDEKIIRGNVITMILTVTIVTKIKGERRSHEPRTRAQKNPPFKKKPRTRKPRRTFSITSLITVTGSSYCTSEKRA